MIAVDSNILVYAHRRDVPEHAAAARCLTELAEGQERWAIPWPCVYEFFSKTTHPRIFHPPSTRAQALLQLEAWFASPSLGLIGETDPFWPGLSKLVEAGRIAGPMVHDARIAAICLHHGVRELWTADRDFDRFPNLRVRNPLVDDIRN